MTRFDAKQKEGGPSRRGPLSLCGAAGFALVSFSVLLFALAPASRAVPGEDVIACLVNAEAFGQGIDHPDADANADGNTDRGFSASGALPLGAVPLDEIGDTIGPTALTPVGNLLDVENGSNTSAADGNDADPGANTWPPGQSGDQDYRLGTDPRPFRPFLNTTFPTACVHADVNGALGILETDHSGAYAAEIVAGSGSYESIVCGTGSMMFRAVLATTDPEVPVLRARYWMMFAAGQGALFFEGNLDSDTNPDNGVGRDLAGTGVVNVRPWSGVIVDFAEQCVTIPAVGFRITSILVGATDDGTASDNAVVEGITDGGGS